MAAAAVEYAAPVAVRAPGPGAAVRGPAGPIVPGGNLLLHPEPSPTLTTPHPPVTAGSTMTNSTSHPLEPLTPQEVQLAVALLKDHGKVTPTTRFVSVSLKEPDKASVHGI